MPGDIVQNNTTEALVFGPVILSFDDVSPALGIALTVRIRKNGGAFAVPAGAISEVGNGFYKIAPNAVDANTLGRLPIHAEGAGCNPFDDAFDIVSESGAPLVRVNDGSIDFPFGPVFLEADHITGATGKALTVTISKNASAFAAPAGAVTELAYGWYVIAANTNDRDTAGQLIIHATAALCDPCEDGYDIEPAEVESTSMPGAITGQMIATGALREIGIVAATRMPSAAQETDALEVATDLLGTWATEKLFIPGTVISDFAFIANHQTYTLGADGDFDQDTIPYGIDSWSVITSDGLEIAYGEPVSVEVWQSIRDKSASGRPRVLYFDDLYVGGFVKLYFYPKPDTASEQVRLYQRVPAIASLESQTSYRLPFGYPRALKLNLALELADRYGKQVTDRLERRAMTAKGAIKRKNYRPKVAGIRPEFLVQRTRRGPFNIYTDG